MNRRGFISSLAIGAAVLPAVSRVIGATKVPGPLRTETYVDYRTELPNHESNREIWTKADGRQDVFEVQYTSIDRRSHVKSCCRLTDHGPVDVCDYDSQITVYRAPIMQNGQLDMSLAIRYPLIKVSWRELS